VYARVCARRVRALMHLRVWQKNRINNDGGAALAKGIANNTTLVEINLMNQPSRWGDGCLDAFLAMFDTNITLLKINWRLESRKSFALNKMITRNNEIDRYVTPLVPLPHCLSVCVNEIRRCVTSSSGDPLSWRT
jgi:hypothetical protein